MADGSPVAPADSLWDRLGAIPDRRGRKGRRYGLASVMVLALAAMLAGANDLRAIFRWGRRLPPEALFLLGLERASCHTMYHSFFEALDVEAAEAVLGDWVRDPTRSAMSPSTASACAASRRGCHDGRRSRSGRWTSARSKARPPLPSDPDDRRRWRVQGDIHHGVQKGPDRVVEVVERPQFAKGFVLLPKRWRVEQTIGVSTIGRRLKVDHETLIHVAAAMMMFASITRLLASITAKQIFPDGLLARFV